MLIVDQFEQVFTLNPDLGGEAARQAFITALCSAAATPAGPGQEPAALVVIAVRGDFWDRCAAVPELVGALQDGHFLVGPMTESELRVAITPAECGGTPHRSCADRYHSQRSARGGRALGRGTAAAIPGNVAYLGKT